MNPVCLTCNQEMKVKKNGFVVASLFADGSYYESRHGDKYECPLCHREIVTGFGGPYRNPKEKPDVSVF